MSRLTDREGRPLSGQMPGVVEAIVVDNQDPDGLGRVKVKFPTLPEAPQSTWARVTSPMAGQKRGWVTLPEVGDEVLVSFMHGDFNHAIVLGAVYNGVDLPPYANEDGNNDLKVFQSRSGHRVTFDDTSGAERVELVLHNEEIKVVWDSANKKLSVYSGGDILIEAKNKIEITCTDFIVQAQKQATLTAKMIDVKSEGQTTIDGGAQLTLKSAMTNIN